MGELASPRTILSTAQCKERARASRHVDMRWSWVAGTSPATTLIDEGNRRLRVLGRAGHAKPLPPTKLILDAPIGLRRTCYRSYRRRRAPARADGPRTADARSDKAARRGSC